MKETTLILFRSVPIAELNLKLMRYSCTTDSSSFAFAFVHCIGIEAEVEEKCAIDGRSSSSKSALCLFVGW